MRFLNALEMRVKMKNRSHIYNINGLDIEANLPNIKYDMYNDGYMY